MNKVVKSVALFALVSSTVSSAAFAQETLLTLVDSINGIEIVLSEEEFLALDQASINTENEFVDEMTTFEGPLARDVLALLGETGSSIAVMTASNDYTIEIPISDFAKYDVIFARLANGVMLSLRDKGPIWVVYPMSENEELRDPTYNSRLIWQLVRVEIK